MLNTLISPLSSWELLDASAINDAAQITGQRLIGDEYHGYLLTPVPPIPGDHNRDSTVDAADYVVWRKYDSGNSQGYTDWQANFGQDMGAGGGSVGASHPQTSVPEPATLVLPVFAVTGWSLRRGRFAQKVPTNHCP